MDSKVVLNYSQFPEQISSGIVKISEDQLIKLSISDNNTNDVIIEVIDKSFGVDYNNNFVLDYNTAKDFMNILYKILDQIKNKG